MQQKCKKIQIIFTSQVFNNTIFNTYLHLNIVKRIILINTFFKLF